jgi:hypothetical protein
MPGLNIPVFVVALFNFFMLLVILVLVYLFVIRDARKRQIGWPQTFIWTVLSVTTFPVIFLIYLAFIRKNKSVVSVK